MARQVGVNFKLTATERVSKVLSRVSRSLDKLKSRVTKTINRFKVLQARTAGLRKGMKKLGAGMRRVGRGMMVGVTAPIGLAGAAIIRTSLNFQKSINKLGAISQTIIKGKVSKDFERLEALALKLGSTTEFSSTQAADAMINLSKAGFKVNEILEVTDDVLALASATGMDLAFTADVLAKTMRQFGLEADQAGRVTDVLALISAKSNVDMTTLAETFKDAAPIAKEYGLSLEQLAAVTGLLGDIGIQGSKAGTTLKAIMLKLISPSKKAAEAMKIMNISIEKGSDGLVDVGSILDQLAGKLQKLPKKAQLQLINELFGLRGIAGAAGLMTRAIEEGKDPIAIMTNVLLNANGAAKDMQQTMLRGLPGSMARLESATEGLMLKVGKSGLIGVFADMVEGLTEWIGTLSEAETEHLAMGTVILGVVAAMGPLLFAFGGFLAILPAMITGVTVLWTLLAANPIILAAALFAIAALLVIKNWTGIKEMFSDMWGDPAMALEFFAFLLADLLKPGGIEDWEMFKVDFTNMMGELATDTFLIMDGMFLSMEEKWIGMRESAGLAFDGMVLEMSENWELIKGDAILAMDTMIEGVSSIWNKLDKLADKALDPIFKQFAKLDDLIPDFLKFGTDSKVELKVNGGGSTEKLEELLKSKVELKVNAGGSAEKLEKRSSDKGERRTAPEFGFGKEKTIRDIRTRTTTNEQTVTVDFKNAPPGTKVSQRGKDSGRINTKLGFQGI